MSRNASRSEQRVHAMELELEELRRKAEQRRALCYQCNRSSKPRGRSAHETMIWRHGDNDKTMRRFKRPTKGLRCWPISATRPARVQRGRRFYMEGLITELSDHSRRKNEPAASRDNDLATVHDLDIQVKDYELKYKQAKKELRSVKATSQLFLQPPKVAINCPYPEMLMKNVVNSVTAIGEDVRAFERRPQRDRAEVDFEALQSLRGRLGATLSNLVTATKTHATSAGMSPPCLGDSDHKATKAEQEQFAPATNGTTVTNGYAPSVQRPDPAGRHAH
ncbi:hypothetical protein C2E23DRAFT_898707 [Lenzites betulinus]|nr:hypothetical protein C2E23DRAFT_898707 [Lenzites betulinus]